MRDKNFDAVSFVLLARPQELIISSSRTTYIQFFFSSPLPDAHALVSFFSVRFEFAENRVHKRGTTRVYDSSNQWVIRWCYVHVISVSFHRNLTNTPFTLSILRLAIIVSINGPSICVDFSILSFKFPLGRRSY